MGTIRSKLLERAEFGKFSDENKEALATLDKEKRNLRTKRKLKAAQSRSEQVRVKFDGSRAFRDMNSELPNIREAIIKVGNKVTPVRATFSYGVNSDRRNPDPAPRIRVHGLYSTNKQKGNNPVNDTFRPSQLKEVINVFKKRFPSANRIVGERVTGVRKNKPFAMARIPLKGKKLGLLGLGLSLTEAIRAGSAAYKAKEAEGKM